MATKRKYPPTADRVGIFTAAWREIATEASFAGMTLAEFETKTAPLAQSMAKLQALDAQYAAELKARDEAETTAKEAMRMAAHGVRGKSSLRRGQPALPCHGLRALERTAEWTHPQDAGRPGRSWDRLMH